MVFDYTAMRSLEERLDRCPWVSFYLFETCEDWVKSDDKTAATKLKKHEVERVVLVINSCCEPEKDMISLEKSSILWSSAICPLGTTTWLAGERKNGVLLTKEQNLRPTDPAKKAVVNFRMIIEPNSLWITFMFYSMPWVTHIFPPLYIC